MRSRPKGSKAPFEKFSKTRKLLRTAIDSSWFPEFNLKRSHKSTILNGDCLWDYRTLVIGPALQFRYVIGGPMFPIWHCVLSLEPAINETNLQERSYCLNFEA